MEYEDRIRIATPEGVDLEVVLAGVGSRMLARLVDLLIIGAGVLVAMLIYTSSVGDSFAGLVAVVGVLLAFLLVWGYETLFEAFNSGRTPGKAALGLRVVNDRGGPEGFVRAAVRNVLRLIDDVLLGLVGLVSIIVTERNQRLGDLAAGTLVVRTRTGAETANALSGIAEGELPAAADSWDATAVTDEELAAARHFLERRDQLVASVRASLAADLAARLRGKVHNADGAYTDEEFVEILAAVKSSRG